MRRCDGDDTMYGEGDQGAETLNGDAGDDILSAGGDQGDVENQ